MPSMKHSKKEIREQLADLGAYRSEGESERFNLDTECQAVIEAVDRLLAKADAVGEGGVVNPHEPQRRPKAKGEGTHNKCEGLAESSDRIVRRLTAHPSGIEPVSDAARRAEQRLIQEAAAFILRRKSAARSPARLRRTA